MEEIEFIFDSTKEAMSSSLDHLGKELQKISTGKANPVMLNGLRVDYYGSQTPLNQVANVSIADARTLAIQPWEKSMLAPIEKSIFEANLGVTPQNDGEIIRIIIPPLTQERRQQLVKQAKGLSEDAKVSIRNARRDAMSEIKKEVKNGFPEDMGKRKEQEMDDLTKEYSNKADQMLEAKEKDILTI